MAARGRGAIWVACLLVALTPGSALAKQGAFVIDASRSAEFHLKASHGYSISVFANHGQVELTARHGSESATYSARGHTDKGHVRARFGKLGSVAVRLHPSGKPRLVPQPSGNCRGKGELVTRGMFVGTIAFRGEQLYTTLRATRARGKEIKAFKQTCHEVKESGSSPLQVTLLVAHATPQRSRSGSKFTSLAAFKIASKPHPALDSSFFSVSLLETGEKLSITRTTAANADPKAFALSEPSAGTTSVTIAPPAPFSGTATYMKEKGASASWGGDLSVPFLGVGVVPLAGEGWTADLVRPTAGSSLLSQ